MMDLGVEEFWNDVTHNDPRDCWPHKGQPNRYGFIRLKDKTYVHQMAYALTVGLNVKELKGRKEKVFQMCHNRKCCNPHHLKMMTLQDYTQLLWNEGRFRDLNLPKTLLMKDPKLPHNLIKRIRVLWLGGYDIKEIKWRVRGPTTRQILYYLFPEDLSGRQ